MYNPLRSYQSKSYRGYTKSKPIAGGCMQPSACCKYDEVEPMYCEEKEEKQMDGSGFMSFLDNLGKVADDYGKTLNKLGVSAGVQNEAKRVGSQVENKILTKLEQKGAPASVIKGVKAGSTAIAKELDKKLGKGMHGDGFWDFLRVLSFLPIPFISDMARTVSMIKTGIDKAQSKHKPSFNGTVSKIVKAVPVIGSAAGELTDMVGFGEMSEEQALEVIKVSGNHLTNILDQIPASEKALLKPEERKIIDDVSNAGKELARSASEVQAQNGNGLLGDLVNIVLPKQMRTKKSDKELLGDVANAILPIKVRKGKGWMADDIRRVLAPPRETLTQYIERKKKEKGPVSSGKGLLRSGDGLRRAGEGVGSALKAKMIEQYGVNKY